MKFQLAKKGIYFIPATDPDKDKAKKIGQGEIVTVEYNKNRNYLFHKKFFALIQIGFENQELYESFEHYRTHVLCEIGYCYMIFHDNGTTSKQAKSISFEALPDNNDFERLVYNPAVRYVAAKLSMSNEELAYEVESQFT
jgi:hypothetical protein